MNKTRIALLATLSDLHREPIRYDLNELARVVADAQPDLLGVEIEQAAFEQDDLSMASLEVREALLPLARRSDVVVVPLGAGSPEELSAPREGSLLSERTLLIGWLDSTLTGIQRRAGDARRVNSVLVSHACGMICHLQAYASGERGRRAWEATNTKILENIRWMAEHDPSARILVAVQCRRKHWLEARLRKWANIELAPYWEL
jgi:hypothetical protein